jgi:hypothetical protein
MKYKVTEIYRERFAKDNNLRSQTPKRPLKNNSPLFLPKDLTPLVTLLEADSLESVAVFVLMVFVTSTLVVTLRETPAQKRTVQVSIATSMIQLAWVRYQKSSIGEMHL